MDISPKLYEQYCTYYVSLPASPILLVAIETLELLGGAVSLLVQFQSAQAGIAFATDVTVVDLLAPCNIVDNIRETAEALFHLSFCFSLATCEQKQCELSELH